jgi:hypothetical protein
MDTRTEQRAADAAARAAGDAGWHGRGGRYGAHEGMCGATAAPDNERIREMLGWGLISPNDGWRRQRH